MTLSQVRAPESPALKIQPDTLDGVNTITRHDAGRIVVGAQAHAHSVVVPWTGPVLDWQLSRFDDLTPAHFEQLVALRPELVIFGSGSRMRFAPPALLRSLIAQRIGVECMDTPAACRTYNVLVTERRSVVAALIVELAGG
jgi:uncharacterized protein